LCRFSDAGTHDANHALRRPASEKRQGTKSRVGNVGGAATMGISPRAQASMWWDVAATRALLPRGMCVNWIVNGSRVVLVTQSCAFEFCGTATLT
jgi:hypothetical protein